MIKYEEWDYSSEGHWCMRRSSSRKSVGVGGTFTSRTHE